jgi:hypothetical protein
VAPSPRVGDGQGPTCGILLSLRFLRVVVEGTKGDVLS